jgi:hypothetical protein
VAYWILTKVGRYGRHLWATLEVTAHAMCILFTNNLAGGDSIENVVPGFFITLGLGRTTRVLLQYDPYI